MEQRLYWSEGKAYLKGSPAQPKKRRIKDITSIHEKSSKTTGRRKGEREYDKIAWGGSRTVCFKAR